MKPETLRKKHPNYVVGWDGNIQQLAQSIGNMSYDKVAEFLDKLYHNIVKQAESDYKNKRYKLSFELYKTAAAIAEASNSMQKAWEICKPFMPKT